MEHTRPERPTGPECPACGKRTHQGELRYCGGRCSDCERDQFQDAVRFDCDEPAPAPDPWGRG